MSEHMDLDAIEQAAHAVPPQQRTWTQMQEQDGEILPDGSGYCGDYEPSREVAIVTKGEALFDVVDLPSIAIAAFMAAADPETVLSLVAEVKRLRREVADANLVMRLDEQAHCVCHVERCPWMPVTRIRFADDGQAVFACRHHKDAALEIASGAGDLTVDKRLADGSWSGTTDATR